MSLILDASLIVKLAIPEPYSADARRIAASGFVAPELWLSEVSNALWKRARHGDITSDDAVQALADLQLLPQRSEPLILDAGAALQLGLELDHPVYDCFYLACAIRLDTHVVTADRRFHTAVSRRPDLVGRVRLLGAEAPA